MASECRAASACLTRMCISTVAPAPMHVAAEMFTPASLIAAAASASAPGVFSSSITRSTAMRGRLRDVVAALRMARQPVVGQRLPRCRVAHELARARADPGVLVEGAHADPDRVGVAGIAPEQRRAAVAAEPFLAATLRLPLTQPVLAPDDPEGARRGMGVGRCARAAAALTAPTVAVARGHERRVTSKRTAPQLQPPVSGSRVMFG